MTIPYYLCKKGLIEAAQCIEEQGCDAVLEEDEWRLLKRIYKPKGHKNTGAPSLKMGLSVDSKIGWAIWEGWNTLQSHDVGYRMAKNILADGEELMRSDQDTGAAGEAPAVYLTWNERR